MITAREAINRGYNLLGIGIVAISSLAFASDIPGEIGLFSYVLDEYLMLALAILAVVWYVVGRNKYSLTVTPIIFAVAALVIKVVGLVLEIADPEDRGDEFGAIVLFAVTILVLIWQYVVSRRLASQLQDEVPIRQSAQV